MSETAEIWKRRVASWRASGKTAEAFSAGRGWSAKTLQWWASRLGRDAREAAPVVRVAQLVRAPSRADDGVGRGVVVVEGGAARVRVTIETGADRELVMAVLEWLGRSDR